MKPSEQIAELEKSLQKLENLHASFDYLRITLASPSRIRNFTTTYSETRGTWGEISEAETINFRTHTPENYGLFCQKTFGPVKDWSCKCGIYVDTFIPNKACEYCLVELVESRVRRYRMGHVNLAIPITHLWYLKGIPNYLCLLLKVFEDKEGTVKERKEKELKVSQLESIAYFREGEYSRLPEWHALARFEYATTSIISDQVQRHIDYSTYVSSTPTNYQEYLVPEIKRRLRRRSGSEIIQAALEAIDIKGQIEEDRFLLADGAFASLVKVKKVDKTIVRRVRILESFLATNTNPAWMVLTILPVLPPSLRPLVELEGGLLVAADVNEIYRLIINRNQRLCAFLYRLVVPEMITLQGRKLLQESVDSLIDNARVPKERKINLNNKPLKSLTEILEGKQGRFRQTLLGKRVDYSGRSVIIVGPTLRLNQCGIPYEMAAELFKPFLIRELLKTKIKPPSHNTRLANLIIRKNKPFVWSLLIALTKKYSVLLNRAPTLHRFGIQAFDPVIVIGQAIHLHPLVCTGFNADFDGDQMALHLPLYSSSQLEVRTMMRPSYNVLSPSNGEVILKPSQDMVIGCYYLTLMIHQNKYRAQTWFANQNQALHAFYQKKCSIHTPILVRYSHLDFQIKPEGKEILQSSNQLFQKFLLLGTIYTFDVFQKSVSIFKIIPASASKFYFLTSVGIFIGYQKNLESYQITDLFLETTPGRILFSVNLQNSLQQNNYDS